MGLFSHSRSPDRRVPSLTTRVQVRWLLSLWGIRRTQRRVGISEVVKEVSMTRRLTATVTMLESGRAPDKLEVVEAADLDPVFKQTASLELRKPVKGNWQLMLSSLNHSLLWFC
ncbi:hypothetical protein PM082_023286 [Marasmius tenuissimus]|nr:hypothetical protein PM082_023286 [Marasmius tenuissimus]